MRRQKVSVVLLLSLLFLWLTPLLHVRAQEGKFDRGAHRVAMDHLNRGLTKLANRDFDGARAEFKFILRHKDTGVHKVAHLNLGVISYIQGNIPQAINSYQTAIENSPGYADAYFNLGTAYYKQGNVKNSEEAFLKAIELQPGYGRAHYSLGSLYLDQKRYELARKHAEKAQELGIPYKTLQQRLSKVGDAS